MRGEQEKGDQIIQNKDREEGRGGEDTLQGRSEGDRPIRRKYQNVFHHLAHIGKKGFEKFGAIGNLFRGAGRNLGRSNMG